MQNKRKQKKTQIAPLPPTFTLPIFPASTSNKPNVKTSVSPPGVQDDKTISMSVDKDKKAKVEILKHPISEETLWYAANNLIRNQKGKIIKNLDKRCDLNITFVEKVLYENIIPNPGETKKKRNLLNFETLHEIPDGYFQGDNFVFFNNTNIPKVIEKKKDQWESQFFKQETGEPALSFRQITLASSVTGHYPNTNSFVISKEGTHFTPQRAKRKIISGDNSLPNKNQKAEAFPQNLQAIEAELAQSQDSPRYGLVHIPLTKRTASYDFHTIGFYGYGNFFCFIDVTNPEESKRTFKKLQDGLELQHFKDFGFIFYKTKRTIYLNSDSISLDEKKKQTLIDPAVSITNRSLTTATSPRNEHFVLEKFELMKTRMVLSHPISSPETEQYVQNTEEGSQSSLSPSSSLEIASSPLSSSISAHEQTAETPISIPINMGVSTQDSIVPQSLPPLSPIPAIIVPSHPQQILAPPPAKEKTKSRDEIFRCDFSKCGWGFHKEAHLVTHKKTHKEMIPITRGVLRCDFPECGKKFPANFALTRHKKTHDKNQRKHECEECGRKFLESFQLKRHKQTHTGEKPFPCEICGNTYADNTNLKKHKANIHQIFTEQSSSLSNYSQAVSCTSSTSSSVQVLDEKKKSTLIDPAVSITNRSLTTATSPRNEHFVLEKFELMGTSMVLSHPQQILTPPPAKEETKSRDKIFRCDFSKCGRGFNTKAHLVTHKKVHKEMIPITGGVFRCDFPECGKKFSANFTLTRHKKTHDKNQRKHECEECGDRFLETRQLKRHKQTHTGEKPFPCEICGNAYADNVNLKKHKANIHQILTEQSNSLSNYSQAVSSTSSTSSSVQVLEDPTRQAQKYEGFTL